MPLHRARPLFATLLLALVALTALLIPAGATPPRPPLELRVVLLETPRPGRDTPFAVDNNLFAAWLFTKCKEQDCRIDQKGETIPLEEAVIRRMATEDLELGKKRHLARR